MVESHRRWARMFPIHDWQFWVVSVLCLAAGAVLARKLWVGVARLGRKGVRKGASLTIDGRTPGQRRGGA